MDFRNKNALVTGAANGVGRALAIQLCSAGARVVLWDIDEGGLAETRRLCAHPDAVEGLRIDLRDTPAIDREAQAMAGRIGSLHVLINNAAVSVESPLALSPAEDVDWVLDLDLKAAVHVTRALLPVLLRSGEAAIMNVSSAAGLTGFPNKTLYCAAKTGLKGFTEALHTELFGSNVHVGCAHPGPVATDMLSRSRIFDPAKAEKMRRYLSAKGQSPDKVAAAILVGIQKKRLEVLVSSETRIVWWMKRFIPNLFVKLTGRLRDRLPS
jgi:NAD(P)-dependent dehydrogenase (short-subunit alcohol dehydrogenase family)